MCSDQTYRFLLQSWDRNHAVMNQYIYILPDVIGNGLFELKIRFLVNHTFLSVVLGSLHSLTPLSFVVVAHSQTESWTLTEGSRSPKVSLF